MLSCFICNVFLINNSESYNRISVDKGTLNALVNNMVLFLFRGIFQLS